MSAPFKRGEASNQVSNLFPSTNKVTPSDLVSTFVPHGLRLQQTITSSGSVTIPAGVEWVYVVMAGAGGGEFFGYGGSAGDVSWGWTLAQNTCIIGAGGAVTGGYTRYGHIIARGGAGSRTNGFTNYYGSPGGNGFADNNPQNGFPGAQGGGGGSTPTTASNATAGSGGDGISGGRGARGQGNSGTITAGNGGNGLAGGGGGTCDATTTGTRTGGNGGNGLGIDGTIYTGGLGVSRTNANAGGGGGAGIAGNGGNASGGTGGVGGLGGGGAGAGGNQVNGGAGILYIFY